MIYSKKDWEEMYKNNLTPWDAEKPDHYLVKIIENDYIKPCKVLDLGCGTGNESIFLSQKGFDVTGVDISDVAIEKARIKAKNSGSKCKFVASDITNMVLGEKYDFAFDRRCLHFLNPEDRLIYIQKLNEVLNLGAKFMLIISSEYEKNTNIQRYHFSIGDIYKMFKDTFIFLSIELIILETHKDKPKSYLCMMEKK